jgi:amino acid permease
MIWYLRFCCTVHYFFEYKMKNDDPEIFTFFLTLVLIQLNVFSILCLIGIILHENTAKFSRYDQLVFFIGLAIINYLISFRKLRYLGYQQQRLSKWSAIILIILTFGLFGTIVYSYKNAFFN